MEELEDIVRNGETGNVEFKELLSKRLHLEKERRHSLASQMKHRILNGGGQAVYLLGVTDRGELKGIDKASLEESIGVLQSIATENSMQVTEVRRYRVNGGYVGKLVIERAPVKEHIIIGTAGHVDHGKSTLVGTIVSGVLDDGRGMTRAYLDTQKHEIERGLSADLSYAVYGFDSAGRAIKLKNPLDREEKAAVVKKAAKIVSFVDTVGHEPWLRTTIRGIVGQKLDYGVLTIASDDGITHVTKEHLGILLAMDLPVIIALTKVDIGKNSGSLEKEISDILNLVGRVPKFIRSKRDLESLPSFWETKVLVPVVRTSAITGEGLELLDTLFARLPKRVSPLEKARGFVMYIDKVYTIRGVGTVVSGSIKQGVIKRNQKLYLGPDNRGRFAQVRASSIHVHHLSVDTAEVGEIVGIAVKGVDQEINRGMVITTVKDLRAVWEYEADIMVLNHPTRISRGYEPVVHLETISEAVTVDPLDKDFLAAGDRGRVKMRFKYNPYYITEDQRFVFREGKSKGIGTVRRVL